MPSIEIYFCVFKEQIMKLDVFYNDLLQSAIKDKSDNVSEKKMPKKQSSKYFA